MKRILFLLVTYLMSIQLVWAQFSPIEPDTAKLNKLFIKKNYTQSVGYLYLKTYYKAISGKDSIQYHELNAKAVCAFKQRFEKDIQYIVWACKEAGGISETIVFPKMELKVAKAFVHKLFYEALNNTWTSEYTYEPDGAGCYYKIIQTDTQTIIEIYCGC